MVPKLTKKVVYAFLVLSVGLASIVYQSYANAKEKSIFNRSGITDLKCGYGACIHYPKKCDCANWQGKFTDDDNEKCPCGHKFSDHADLLSD